MLEINQQFGRYRTISVIGSGGMGEVYLAEDTQLKRKVALKVLNLKFSQNEEYQQRFIREAQAISALNHLNIITIYEVGELEKIHFIATEFVEGDSLRVLIKEGKLTLDTIIEIGIGIGSALAAAHTAGIIHRDIKPENILRRTDDVIKVLDFGLAKQTLNLNEKGEIDPDAPTQAQQLTIPGMIMGTATYMSPEQARGTETDERTDIWSLGVVLYEMVAGCIPFTGETKSDMMAAILKSDVPPLSIHNPEVPHELEAIITKAISKKRDDRFSSVQEMLLDLKSLRSESNISSRSFKSNAAETGSFPKAEVTNLTSNAENTVRQRSRWRLAAIPAVLVLFGCLFWLLRQNNHAGEINPASLNSSQVTSWKSDLGEDGNSRARFSPDGKLVAYIASKNGKNSVWLKQIGGGEPFTRKQDDADDRSPVWSPDGGSIAYISNRGERRGIWTIPALGGTPTLLSEIDGGGQLIFWSKDGANIYFEMKQNLYALMLISKQIVKLTNFDEKQPVNRDFDVSPDEKQIVYADKTNGRKDLWTADLHGRNPVRLTDDEYDDSRPFWHPDGRRIIYNSTRNGVRQICLAFSDGRSSVQFTFNDNDSIVSDISGDGTKILYTSNKDDSDLWGARFSDKAGFQITSDIGTEFWQDAAPNGEDLVYQSAPWTSVGNKNYNSSIVTRKIKNDVQKNTLAPDGFNPHYSPDGKQIAFLRLEGGKINLWLTSASGGDARQMSSEGLLFGGFTMLPFNRFQTQDFQWSPDSRALIYCANRDGISNIWETTTDGAGEKRLTVNEDKTLHFLNPLFSPDGSRIVWTGLSVDAQNKRHWSIWMSENGSIGKTYESDVVLQIIGWSASGDELVVKSVNSGNEANTLPADVNISQISLKSGEPHLISTLKNIYFFNIQLSPDRKTVAFVTRQNDSDIIQTLPSTGGTAKTLVSGNDARVYFSNLTFAPDGKTVYYGKQANWQIISMIENFK